MTLGHVVGTPQLLQRSSKTTQSLSIPLGLVLLGIMSPNPR